MVVASDAAVAVGSFGGMAGKMICLSSVEEKRRVKALLKEEKERR